MVVLLALAVGAVVATFAMGGWPSSPLVALSAAVVVALRLALGRYRPVPRRPPSLSAFADEQREKALIRDRAEHRHDLDQR